MPKMRGLLHSKPKIDEAEMALAESRTAARLAALFGDPDATADETASGGDLSADVVETPQGAESAAEPSKTAARPRPRSAGSRPPIVVEGDADHLDIEAADDQVELVGVMARPGDDVGADAWELPAAPEVAVVPDAIDFMTAVEETIATTDEPVEPVERELEPVEPAAFAPVERALEPVEPSPSDDASNVVPIDTARRGASRDKPGRSTSGRPPATRTTRTKARPARILPAFCPYCALLLQPPPTSSRRCDRCRQRIVVKRAEARTVYLTEAAVLVFEAERQRVVTSKRLTTERDRWLRLAVAAGAPAQRTARLAAAPISADSTAATRTLYLATVDRAFAAAKRDHQWETASRLRRDHATALYRLAGSPMPPPADIVAVYREGVAAELRGIAEISRDAELVGATCCDACRADDRRILRIATELRAPRLPHEGCPKGLCRCGWDLAARDRSTIRRYLRSRPRTETRAAPSEPAAPSESATTA